MKIGNKIIGDGHPVFIIAEIGINHNADLEIVKKLIDVAKEAGCDAVKFQKRTPDICVPNDMKKKKKETPWGILTYLDYKKKMEFNKEQYTEIDKYCKKKNIIWFASVWDIPSVAFMEMFDTPCYKIPSACLTDKELLRAVAITGKPIILSTGMSSMYQISCALTELKEYSINDDIALLQCNSTYPSIDEELDLNVIVKWKQMYSFPIGYSGHEKGLLPTVAATILGANIIERHITLDRTMWGTDQAASVEPQGWKLMIRDIRRWDIIKGKGDKIVFDSEKKIARKLRRVDNYGSN